jgi:hypothetical protein
MDLMLLFCTMFLYLGIKFIITKLLFFSTFQKPDRHLVMAKSGSGYVDAMKPEKFNGVNFKRWQTKAQLWLSAIGVFWVVSNPPALPLGSEKEVHEFTAATTMMRGVSYMSWSSTTISKWLTTILS